MVNENCGAETVVPTASLRWQIERDAGGHQRHTLQQWVTINGKGQWRDIPAVVVPWQDRHLD